MERIQPRKSIYSSGKLPVAEPTTIGKLAILIVMFVCKKIMLVPTKTVALICLLGTGLISLITDILPPPKTFLANKRHFINQYFVKLGWGWTFALVGVFIYWTASTYCCGNDNLLKRHLCRLLAATCCWYIFTQTFNYVEEATGACNGTILDSNETILNKHECLKAGHTWSGWDISGHAFLLVYCLLIISEEVKVMRWWDRIAEFIQAEDDKGRNQAGRISDFNLEELKLSYRTLTPSIRVVFGALTILAIIWAVMIFATAVYFHTMPQKMAGVISAVFAWYITYGLLFKLEIGLPFFPCLPGTGSFNFNYR